jgi:single-strand DNA-binding protein
MIKTFGTGRLTKEADLRYISTGTAVVNATIACKRTPDKDGNDRTAFVRIVIWGKRAEAFAQFTDKGSLVSFEGEIETDTFEKNGETQFSTKIVVTDFDFLETKEILHDRRAKVESQRQNMTNQAQGNYQQQPPQQNYQQNQQQFNQGTPQQNYGNNPVNYQ